MQESNLQHLPFEGSTTANCVNGPYRLEAREGIEPLPIHHQQPGVQAPFVPIVATRQILEVLIEDFYPCRTIATFRVHPTHEPSW